jgi:hypothetical protein
MEPIILGCEETLGKFHKDNDEMRSCIVSFDKVLGMKASRTDMALLKQA